ncbi:MAG: CPBP family intramembrane metalloprotease [Sphingomonadales bacterium]|nr:CPBP family intramembrane metalloprotease [Sphingomonadales bacterium]
MDGLARKFGIVAGAIALGMVLALIGHIPKNIIFLANLRHWPEVPWLILPTGIYLWAYWRYLGGSWGPRSTAEFRRRSMRAQPLPPRLWYWSMIAGVLGIIALILVLRVANRVVMLPEQEFFDVSQASTTTVFAIIVIGAIVAGIVEESAFRGYMQGPIEEAFGIIPAVLVTGIMFAVAHLGLTPVLVPYYVAVAALYGTIAWLTRSILPTIVLHTGGNIFSSTYLWLTGHAEWQRAKGHEKLIWQTGTDGEFWLAVAFSLVGLASALWAYARLAHESRLLIEPCLIDKDSSNQVS